MARAMLYLVEQVYVLSLTDQQFIGHFRRNCKIKLAQGSSEFKKFKDLLHTSIII